MQVKGGFIMKTDQLLDAKGLACPMPIVKTKKVMKDMNAGEVLEVQATDKGSKADLEAWAKSTGHQYLGLIEEGEVLKHYLRKSSDQDTVERSYETVASNEDLQAKMDASEDITILDVREAAEYAFNHIPGAVSIPMGELESRLQELQKESAIYVVCRTGNRSDMAAQTLAANGFTNVTNIVPGMSEWKGNTESNH